MEFVNVTNNDCICFNEQVVHNDFVMNLLVDNTQHYVFNNLPELLSSTEGALFKSIFLSTLFNMTSTDTLTETSIAGLNALYIVLFEMSLTLTSSNYLDVVGIIQGTLSWLDQSLITEPFTELFETLKTLPAENYPRAYGAFVDPETHPAGLKCDGNWSVQYSNGTIVAPDEDGCMSIETVRPFLSYLPTFYDFTHPRVDKGRWCSVKNSLEIVLVDPPDTYSDENVTYYLDEEYETPYYDPDSGTAWGFCYYDTAIVTPPPTHVPTSVAPTAQPTSPTLAPVGQAPEEGTVVVTEWWVYVLIGVGSFVGIVLVFAIALMLMKRKTSIGKFTI